MALSRIEELTFTGKLGRREPSLPDLMREKDDEKEDEKVGGEEERGDERRREEERKRRSTRCRRLLRPW